MKSVKLMAVPDIPQIKPGHNLAGIIYRAVKKNKQSIKKGDILVVAQKIVSKAEGRLVNLKKVRASTAARTLAKKLKKDPKHVELILRETKRIIKMGENVLICETRHGFVCANAGVDHSNVPGNCVTLLPEHPDNSAGRLRKNLKRLAGFPVPVIISDSFGRPWREGVCEVAVGASGIRTLLDLRGRQDYAGKRLQATIIAVADQLAAAAGLLMKKNAGAPAVLIRGFSFKPSQKGAKIILRSLKHDLFR